MFYHIRIDYFDKKLKANQTLFEYDYSTEDEVMDKIIVPYLAGKRILFSGSFLDAEDRRQLSVYQTERDIKSMVSYANQNVPEEYSLSIITTTCSIMMITQRTSRRK